MSRINRLFGKPEKVTIDGEVLDIYPLEIDDLDLMTDAESPDKTVRIKALTEVIRLTIRKTVPEATNEEIGKINIKAFKEIMKAIRLVNGIEDEDVDKEQTSETKE